MPANLAAPEGADSLPRAQKPHVPRPGPHLALCALSAEISTATDHWDRQACPTVPSALCGAREGRAVPRELGRHLEGGYFSKLGCRGPSGSTIQRLGPRGQSRAGTCCVSYVAPVPPVEDRETHAAQNPLLGTDPQRAENRCFVRTREHAWRQRSLWPTVHGPERPSVVQGRTRRV